MKPEIRVGIVCRFPLSKKFYSFQLAEALRSVGIKTFLYGPKWGAPQTLKEDKRVQKIWTPLTYVIDITRRAIKDKVHIIHVQFELPTFLLIGSFLLPLLLLILKITRRKVILTLHGPIFPRHETSKYVKHVLPHFHFPIIAGLLIHALYLLIDRLSDGVIVHANVFKRWLMDFGLKKVHVIYHGIENETDNAKMQNEYAEKDIILCLGTIAPRKGVDLFLRAVSLIKDELKGKGIKAVVAGPLPSTLGDGEYLRKLLESYRDTKDIVEVKGFLSDDELEELLRRTRIMCLSYPVSISASGILAIAISKNIPAIVTNTPYFREILGGDYPLLVEPQDPHSLSQIILMALHEKNLILEVHSKFSTLRQSMSWTKVANEHIMLYRFSMNLCDNSA